ncbi:MAG: translation elongation factor Ts [Atopobiaceae bacterium]|jgi:elongation factor Ts|nr:translation elongation factor Ts [Atopobiaceae bacterium]
MAKISAQLVKQLRDMTNSPMMECKKALVEADGDIDKAIDVLRTMGVAKAVKRAGRETNEGTIGAYVSDDSTTGALAELTCETDFVGTNKRFTDFAASLAKAVADDDPADVEAFKQCDLDGETVDAALTEMIHTIGENMKIARIVRRQAEKGAVASYVHLGGKIGVLVEFSFDKPETAQNDEFKTFAHDVAMQVAAMRPVAARREDVPEDVIAHEKSIYMAQAAESGKPEAIQEKMATGRLEKYYKEYVLTEQVFFKDGDLTITKLADKLSKSLGDKVAIVGFDRFEFNAEA